MQGKNLEPISIFSHALPHIADVHCKGDSGMGSGWQVIRVVVISLIILSGCEAPVPRTGRGADASH